MKCLSVRQPFAWLMTHGPTPNGEPYKPVENRRLRYQHRGPLMIHASLRHDTDWTPVFAELLAQYPIPAELAYGGIVGVVNVLDVVTEHASPWFCGPYGLVLDRFAAVPFTPWRGRLGLFDVLDANVVAAARDALKGMGR